MRSLAPVIGISVPSLFGYRSGSIPISLKAWSKLEQAERSKPVYSDTVDPLPILHDDETPYRFTPMVRQIMEGASTPQNLETVLERIATALEKLVEIEQRKQRKNPEP